MLAGKAGLMASRKPDIMSDAAHLILTSDKAQSGHFFVDEEVLLAHGFTPKQIKAYNNTPGIPPLPDFYLGDAAAYERLVKLGSVVQGVAGMFGGGKKKKDE